MLWEDSVADYLVVEDVDRVRELFANAPADRVRRRRGYVVFYRSHPDRVPQVQDIARAHTSMTLRTRSGAKLASKFRAE